MLVVFVIMDFREQRAAVLFLVGKNWHRNSWNAKNGVNKTNAIGNHKFNDKFPSSRPSTTRTDKNVEKTHEVMPTDRARTIGEVVELSEVPWNSVKRIPRPLTAKISWRGSMLCSDRKVSK